MRGPSLVELTGDDNSATLDVTVQIRMSPKEYARPNKTNEDSDSCEVTACGCRSARISRND